MFTLLLSKEEIDSAVLAAKHKHFTHTNEHYVTYEMLTNLMFRVGNCSCGAISYPLYTEDMAMMWAHSHKEKQ